MYGMLNVMILSHAIMIDMDPRYQRPQRHTGKLNAVRYRKMRNLSEYPITYGDAASELHEAHLIHLGAGREGMDTMFPVQT